MVILFILLIHTSKQTKSKGGGDGRRGLDGNSSITMSSRFRPDHKKSLSKQRLSPLRSRPEFHSKIRMSALE